MIDEASAPRFVRAPRAVETLLQAIADALDEKPHRLAAHLDKTLDPQHIVARGDVGQLAQQGVGIVDCTGLKDGAVEIVVIVPGRPVMARGPRGKIVFGRRVEAEQDRGVDLALAGGHDFDRARDARRDVPGDAALFVQIDEIGLVEDDEIGAQQLILEHLVERIIVGDRRIGGALARQSSRIVGEAPVRHRLAIDNRDHAIDGQARANGWPIEGLHQGLWQGEAGGFDDDVVGERIEREKFLDRGQKIIGDGAADTAIGEFDDIFRAAGEIAAAV